MKQQHRVWPAVIILSSFAATVVTFVLPGQAMRPLIILWFLCICPGMALVRFLHLREVVVEWTLAIALSIALDAIIAAIFLYAKMWSPSLICALLILLALCGASTQLIMGTGRKETVTENVRRRLAPKQEA